jgi:hypothetical protein
MRKTKVTPPDTLTAAQVAELQPLVARAAIAAVRLGQADDAYRAAYRGRSLHSQRVRAIGAMGRARTEASRAGKALARTLARLGRVAK